MAAAVELPDAQASEADIDTMNASFNRSLFNTSLDSSALSNSSPCTNPKRRESKSRAEKKRRDRINSCFLRMQQLLSDAASEGLGENCGVADSPCAEKAEILEQIIKYVELLRCQRQRDQGDEGVVKNFMSGYKKGVQNIFILMDRVCHEAERLTKSELIAKIKKHYIDSASPMVELGKPQYRPALGDLSNRESAHKLTPSRKSGLSSMESTSSPLPPAKKRRVFRELAPQQQQLPVYEPISPDPFVPDEKGDDSCIWRPWHNA